MNVVDLANFLSFSNDLSGKTSWVLSAYTEVRVESFAVQRIAFPLATFALALASHQQCDTIVFQMLRFQWFQQWELNPLKCFFTCLSVSYPICVHVLSD